MLVGKKVQAQQLVLPKNMNIKSNKFLKQHLQNNSQVHMKSPQKTKHFWGLFLYHYRYAGRFLFVIAISLNCEALAPNRRIKP